MPTRAHFNRGSQESALATPAGIAAFMHRWGSREAGVESQPRQGYTHAADDARQTGTNRTLCDLSHLVPSRRRRYPVAIRLLSSTR